MDSDKDNAKKKEDKVSADKETNPKPPTKDEMIDVD